MREVHFHGFEGLPTSSDTVVKSPEFRCFGHKWTVTVALLWDLGALSPPDQVNNRSWPFECHSVSGNELVDSSSVFHHSFRVSAVRVVLLSYFSMVECVFTLFRVCMIVALLLWALGAHVHTARAAHNGTRECGTKGREDDGLSSF